MVHLDGLIFYLGLPLEPLLLKQHQPPLALLYTNLDAVGALQTRVSAYSVQAVQIHRAEDWRTKEELFKTLLAQGTEVYLLDADPAHPLKSSFHAVRAALVYVQSHKTQSACL